MQKLPEGNLDSLAIAQKTVGSFSHLESASGDEYFGTQELETGKPKMALVMCRFFKNIFFTTGTVGNLGQDLNFSFLIGMLNDYFQDPRF